LLKLDDEEGLVSSYYYLAFNYEKQQNIQKAKEIYERALLLSKQESVREHVEYERSLIEERLSLINNEQLQNKLLNF
jgi:cytochrome c-type biogenesis protein CcmH/NrfG